MKRAAIAWIHNFGSHVLASPFDVKHFACCSGTGTKRKTLLGCHTSYRWCSVPLHPSLLRMLSPKPERYHLNIISSDNAQTSSLIETPLLPIIFTRLSKYPPQFLAIVQYTAFGHKTDAPILNFPSSCLLVDPLQTRYLLSILRGYIKHSFRMFSFPNTLKHAPVLHTTCLNSLATPKRPRNKLLALDRAVVLKSSLYSKA